MKLMTKIKRMTKKKSPNVSETDAKLSTGLAAAPGKVTSLVIERILPQIDGGVFPVKTVVGDLVPVSVDIFKDGHDKLGACICYRRKTEVRWQESPLTFEVNDHWTGAFQPESNTRYVYTVAAWVDAVATWVQFMKKKCPANLNVKTDLAEGLSLLTELQGAASAADAKKILALRQALELSDGASDEVLRIIESDEFKRLTAKYIVRHNETLAQPVLELVVDRKTAEFSTWYEMFPRSQTKRVTKSGTFKDCIRRLPEIKKMGFDVIYLPPIHPIGLTKRKGRNNTLTALAGDPGSPWAIGNREGGHKSVHPELGTIKDFDAYVSAAHDYGLEIALDFAIQCSPDHPYVKDHPEWFFRLPDGTIRYAENPPKKYEDIYPINFYCADYPALWEELRSIVLFWMSHGVKIFRVDNPHTKPAQFWKWLMTSVQEKHPDVIFLAEAFTRPKVMKFLAKAGFTQSYTYFTWRNFKKEIREYAEELTQGEMSQYFRGNFFANTPDILPEILQHGGRPAFKMRLVLAATLSSVYGIYSGYELCEGAPHKPGSEEYLDSEKYEIKVRDWNQPGNLRGFIARINRIRAENPALQSYKNLKFYHSCNENILCYGKKTEDNTNIIIVVVNLNPYQIHEDLVSLPIWDFGIDDWQTYQVKDLITGDKYYWKGQHNYVRLDPHYQPAHIFLLRK